MSDRGQERINPGSGGGGGGDVNVTEWGGVAVSPAAAKTDGMSAALVVPEIGAIAQFFNGASYDIGRSGFVTALTGPFLGVQNNFAMGVFNAVAPVLVDGQAITLQFDSSGQLKTSGGGGGASIGLVGAPVPLSANYTGFIDAAGNLQGSRVYDTDSGAGTELTLGIVLRGSGAGGSVEIGTSANPVVISTAQLPAALVGARLDTNVGAWLGATTPTVGQKTMAASIPVVIASDQTGVPVSGTVTANQGTAAGAAAPWSMRLSDGAAFYDGAKTGQLPAALVGARLDTNIGAWLGSTAPSVGQKAMASSVPVVIASDQTAVPVSGTVTANPAHPATGTTSSVAANVASVTILAANAGRFGGSITNDSATGTLYLKLGATGAASTTDYTAKLIPGAYYEIPPTAAPYTGIIQGIWDIASGSARVTEWTA